jgi:ribosome-binding factor A
VKTELPRPSGAPSQRQRRVGEVIRETLATMLARGDIHDDVLAARIVTVAGVIVSPDLKLATIAVSPLGGGGGAEVLTALNSNRRYIRGEIARRINLKFAPDIRFRLDDGLEAALRIDAILDSQEVRRDTGAPSRRKID